MRPRFHIIAPAWGCIVSYETKETRDLEVAGLRTKFPEMSFTLWDGLIYGLEK